MSTNNSREILACRRQVLSREQESTRVEQAKTIAKESALEEEEEEKNFREEIRQVERVRARRRRVNYSEKRRQAERDRARMNRQRQPVSYTHLTLPTKRIV